MVRDVVRLILRHLRNPYEARGLLGANRFWREAAIAYYESGSRAALQCITRVPTYHSLQVVCEQVTHAPAATVVILDMLWTTYEQVHADSLRLGGLYSHQAAVMRDAENKVEQRKQQIVNRQWGVKRAKSRRLNAESDEDWTRRMLSKAEKNLEKMKATSTLATVQKQWQARSDQAYGLRALIDSHYEQGGAIGSYQPAGQPWRFLAEYPQLQRGVKRRVRETLMAHEAANTAERELSVRLHKECSNIDRAAWPKLW